MPTYVIGDIQGCFAPLQCLLQQLQFKPDRDQLWLCGDLVNRGPQSLDTLRYLHQRRDNLVCVLGNHDLHLLAVARGLEGVKTADTLQDILDAPDASILLEWLRSLPLLHRDANHQATLVHAGIPPHWSLQQAMTCAAEVATQLRGPEPDSFLAGMYGNKPDRWQDSLTGAARWRLITNYFTRMRFCTAEGRLEFDSKEGPGDAPKGFAPWFTHPHRIPASERIVFGHWAALNGETHSEQFIGLDTGCVWGGALTAYCLETGERTRCDCSA